MIADGFDLHFCEESLSKMTYGEIVAKSKWFSEWSKQLVSKIEANQSPMAEKFLLKDIIGMRICDIKEWIEGDGYTWRITRENNNHFIITCDLQLKRINFEIDNELITKAYIG